MTVAQLIDHARSWVGTPYHHRARVKGAGVDCGQLIIAVHVEAGLVADFDTGFYTSDWHLHRYENRYLEFVEAHLGLVDSETGGVDQRLSSNALWQPPAGSVIVFKVGRTYSHGALVTGWPLIIHAYQPSGIVEEVSILHTPMARRDIKIYMHGDLI